MIQQKCHNTIRSPEKCDMSNKSEKHQLSRPRLATVQYDQFMLMKNDQSDAKECDRIMLNC